MSCILSAVVMRGCGHALDHSYVDCLCLFLGIAHDSLGRLALHLQVIFHLLYALDRRQLFAIIFTSCAVFHIDDWQL